MNRILVVGSLALAGLCVAVSVSTSNGGESTTRTFAHDVYFTLNESNRVTRQRLVDACETYLRGHEGAVFFAAGTRATEMKRDVNDGDFDVSLHIYFRAEAAHEAYQKHPRHAEFIKRMNDNWKTVRVFDSWVEYVSADTPLPESVKTVSIVD
jgi:hypothetical protein